MMQPHPNISVSVSAIRVLEAYMNPGLDNLAEISHTILIRCSIRIPNDYLMTRMPEMLQAMFNEGHQMKEIAALPS